MYNIVYRMWFEYEREQALVLSFFKFSHWLDVRYNYVEMSWINRMGEKSFRL